MSRYSKINILLLCQFLILGTIDGQDNGVWNQGVIVFRDSTVLVGDVQLNFQHKILQYHSKGALRSIPSWQILKVNLHDQTLGCVRQFISIPFSDESTRGDEFFEVIINGQIQIIARDRFPGISKYIPVTLPGNLVENQASEFVDQKDFFLYDGKNLIPMHKFNKLALPAFARYFEEEMERFIRNEKLNTNLLSGQIKVVKIFNKLYAESILTAKR